PSTRVQTTGIVSAFRRELGVLVVAPVAGFSPAETASWGFRPMTSQISAVARMLNPYAPNASLHERLNQRNRPTVTSIPDPIPKKVTAAKIVLMYGCSRLEKQATINAPITG